ncbi:hypothetical protein BH10PLA2_BH10PLA2_16150 [soil metagenome]
MKTHKRSFVFGAESPVVPSPDQVPLSPPQKLGSPLPAAGEGLWVRGNTLPNPNRRREPGSSRRETQDPLSRPRGKGRKIFC